MKVGPDLPILVTLHLSHLYFFDNSPASQRHHYSAEPYRFPLTAVRLNRPPLPSLKQKSRALYFTHGLK
jgi:hypothetical protein